MSRYDTDRVRAHTAPEILFEIDGQIEARVRFFATQSKGSITRRIAELEAEWDIDQWLTTNATVAAAGGLFLGMTVNRKWLWLTGGILGFLFQHAVQGWSPPIGALRRAGIRTRSEIERERFAMKALRGDFEKVSPRTQANDLLRAGDVLRAVTA